MPALYLAMALLLALSAPAAAEPRLVLDTPGGDAWTFHMPVTGTLQGEPCESVAVSSPAGSVPAWHDGRRFHARVPLAGGVNSVRASCLADGAQRGRSATQRWNQRLDDVPRAWVRVRVDDAHILLDAGASRPAPGRPAPLTRYRWHAPVDNPAPLVTADGAPLDRKGVDGRALALAAPRVDGDYYVSLRVEDAHGRVDQARGMFRVRDGRPLEVDLEREHPAWVDRAVMYGVVPFFFGPGGYRDVEARLDEIAALGATVIWLSPVTASPPDDFGYAVTDHFGLRPSFGSAAEFRRLVRAAHARGLKVIMDFVPNHFSDRHPYFVHAQREGRSSPYYDWFERDAKGEVTQYFDWENLKNLDYDNPEVANYIIAAAVYWVRHYGIDGFRVDVGWGVRQRAPEFWERWRAELKRVDPDLLLLVEASARDGYYVANGFDVAYDWSEQLGEWAWKDVFGADGVDLARLRAALTNRGAGYPPDTLALRFLNNNDTGERFISRHGPGLTRVAAALTFTLPGLPLIYTGDEVGAEYEPYDEGPPLDWRDPHRLAGYYGRLARLRGQLPGLWGRQLELVGTDQDQRVLAFLRPGRERAEDVLVVLNFSGRPVGARLLPEAGVVALAVDGAVDRLEGGPVKLDPALPRVELPAYGARILTRRPAP